MIEPRDIYDKTDNGLDIIFSFYPQAREAVNSKKKHFRIRPGDKTPSAALFLKKESDGSQVWKVKDFGDDKAISPIDICMAEKGMKFTEAIHYLAGIYNVAEPELVAKINKPDIRKNPATEDEPNGSYFFQKKAKFTPSELRLLGPHVEQEHCDTLGYFSLEYYKSTKEGTTLTIYSNDNYPIFMRECKYKDGNCVGWIKFYGPADGLIDFTYQQFMELQIAQAESANMERGINKLLSLMYKRKRGKSSKWIRKISKNKKTAILWFYLGCINFLQKRFSLVFSGESSSGDVTDGQMRIIDALAKNDVTKKADVRNSDLYEALYTMQIAAEESEKLREKK